MVVLAVAACAGPVDNDTGATPAGASSPAAQAGEESGAGPITEPGTAVQNTEPGTEMTIEEAHEALTEPVMALEGVVGIGIGECDGVPCIVVYLAAEDEKLTGQIPDEYGGHPVRTVVTGEIRGPRPIG